MRQWRNGRRATLRGWSGQPGVGSSPTCRTNAQQNDMEIKIRKYTVQVVDSYQVHKKDFDKVIDELLCIDILKRSRKSLRLEWAAHNFLYNLGIKKDKTGNVDFDFVQSGWERFLYGILGRIAWIFIK